MNRHNYLLICFVVVLASFKLASAQQRIEFFAEDTQSNESLILDSVHVVVSNLNLDTTLIGTNELVLNKTVGMENPRVPSVFHLSGNFANPFTSQTQFTVISPIRSPATISLYSVNGKRIAYAEVTLLQGSSHFILQGDSLPSGLYILEVQNKRGVKQTSKLVKTGTSGSGAVRIESAGSATGVVTSFGKVSEILNLQVTGYATRYQADVFEPCTELSDDSKRDALAIVCNLFIEEMRAECGQDTPKAQDRS
ncbi:MAG: hypothetical protein CL946_07985 [Ectothiorhodospiraceae bacterium]|nr:hypothetical protein [Ectothiorhodospiraceae bacterium]